MTDKLELGYGPTYDQLADELARHPRYAGPGRPVRLLEVGVASGSGMDYFSYVFQTEMVYGVDNKPESGKPDQYDRIITCSQDDANLPLVLQGRGWAPFDVIVDDASHMAGPTAITLALLWPLVAPGGLYVIEDWNYYQGPGVAQNVWQKLFGGFLAHPQVGPQSDPNPYSGTLDDVESVSIREGMIVVRRKP